MTERSQKYLDAEQRYFSAVQALSVALSADAQTYRAPGQNVTEETVKAWVFLEQNYEALISCVKEAREDMEAKND